MAQKVTVTLVDDLDGSKADETVEFTFDGAAYQIDLSATNAGALRDALAGFVGHARRSGGRKRNVRPGARPDGGSTAAGDREQNQAIREWARKRGMKVSDRGRIPAEVIDAYHEAN
ncbi:MULTISPECIES: histone-like nucleoid-structuring protein Lsr2 [Actinoalloteichus]|uniref:Lsr2 n=1 Tax=Actinoalloteichus fjordicus TaxID=1612552 RepID=A0AAC9PQ04_9PSEU|nr:MULTISPECIES: Lsr2 family protein [Actinoalloteichus]APU12411.1 Lsr2 [Actinoalloteichus fjordicus]APU18364.1 Lsr2 [Actinoalloteichus sp. GBA129-24]